jgi:3-oxoacyl-[acyl-carrier protein] reductase
MDGWAKGKRVLVTGGSQGIGRATAAAFRAIGAEVIVTGTRPSLADYDEPLDGVTYVQADLSSEADRARLAEAAGALDVLVNNAGGGRQDEYTLAGFAAVIELNLVAQMDMCLRCHAGLKARGGNIVNVGSLASFLAIKEVPGYTASKTGLLGLTRALGDRWSKDGIRVNMVAPGFIQTRMTDAHRGDEGHEKRLLKAVPMQRWGRPEEIAEPILFLASPAAAYITGASLAIDGGLMLR